MVARTAHFTQMQLERLAELATAADVSEAELLREALDDLIMKYEISHIFDRERFKGVMNHQEEETGLGGGV